MSDILVVLGYTTFGAKGPKTGGDLTTNSLIGHLCKSYDVSIMCGGPEPPQGDTSPLTTIHWVRPPSLRYLGIGTWMASHRKTKRQLKSVIDEISPRLIIGQGRVIPAVVAAAHHCGIPSLAIVRGYENLSLYEPVHGDIPTLIDYRAEPVERGLKMLRDTVVAPVFPIFRALNRSALRKATGVVVNSKFMARVMKRYCDVEASVIYPHVSCTGCGARGSGIGFVKPQIHKGSRVVRGIAEELPDVDFKWFGTMDSRTRKMSLPNNVKMCGWLENIEDIYRQVELVVVPSQWPEPFGRVAAESLQAKTPCLVSNTGGLREVVGTERALVNRYGDLCAWVAKIRQVLSTKPTREFLSGSIYDRAAENFAPATALTAWREIVRGLIN